MSSQDSSKKSQKTKDRSSKSRPTSLSLYTSATDVVKARIKTHRSAGGNTTEPPPRWKNETSYAGPFTTTTQRATTAATKPATKTRKGGITVDRNQFVKRSAPPFQTMQSCPFTKPPMKKTFDNPGTTIRPPRAPDPTEPPSYRPPEFTETTTRGRTTLGGITAGRQTGTVTGGGTTAGGPTMRRSSYLSGSSFPSRGGTSGRRGSASGVRYSYRVVQRPGPGAFLLDRRLLSMCWALLLFLPLIFAFAVWNYSKQEALKRQLEAENIQAARVVAPIGLASQNMEELHRRTLYNVFHFDWTAFAILTATIVGTFTLLFWHRGRRARAEWQMSMFYWAFTVAAGVLAAAWGWFLMYKPTEGKQKSFRNWSAHSRFLVYLSGICALALVCCCMGGRKQGRKEHRHRHGEVHARSK